MKTAGDNPPLLPYNRSPYHWRYSSAVCFLAIPSVIMRNARSSRGWMGVFPIIRSNSEKPSLEHLPQPLAANPEVGFGNDVWIATSFRGSSLIATQGDDVRRSGPARYGSGTGVRTTAIWRALHRRILYLCARRFAGCRRMRPGHHVAELI